MIGCTIFYDKRVHTYESFDIPQRNAATAAAAWLEREQAAWGRARCLDDHIIFL